MKTQIKELIDEFINFDKSIKPELEATILCGSHANGLATDHSDIDLCCIGNFKEFRREYRTFQDYEFQLMIAPWEWYHEVISTYERKGNIGTITSMLANGICWWSSNETRWSALKEEAIKFFGQGPTPVSKDEVLRIRRRITELYNNFIDELDELTSKWIKNQIMTVCVEAHFTIRNWWAVKTKYQINVLRDLDPEFVRFIEESINNDKAVKKLCNYILNPVGGLILSKKEDL